MTSDGSSSWEGTSIKFNPNILQARPKVFDSIVFWVVHFIDVDASRENIFARLEILQLFRPWSKFVIKLHLTLVRIIPLVLFLLRISKLLDIADKSSRFKLLTGRLFIVIVAIPVLSLTSTSTKSLGGNDDLCLTVYKVAHFVALKEINLVSLKAVEGNIIVLHFFPPVVVTS